MTSYLLSIVSILCGVMAQAQQSHPIDSLVSVRHKTRTVAEIGFNATSFLNSIPEVERNRTLSFDPIILQLKLIFNDKAGIRIGIGGSFTRSSDDIITSSIPENQIIKDGRVNLRLGYENRIVVGPKWQVYFGFDTDGGYRKTESSRSYNINIPNNLTRTTTHETWRIGGGGIFGVLFFASSRFLIGAEMSAKLFFINKTSESISFGSLSRPGGNYDITFEFMAPTAIFIAARFGKQFQRKHGFEPGTVH